jgi:MFS family permease
MSTVETAAPVDERFIKRPTNVRVWVIAGLALASTIAYLSRFAMAPVATTIQAEYRLTNDQLGWILGAFQIGYFSFQVPGGWLANRFGNRVVLPLICALWSLCSLWTGAAASPTGLLWSRVAAGLAQGGLVPCSARAVHDWAPPSSRGIASSAVATSMSIGAVIASGLTAALLPHIGWRGVFAAYTGVGIVWAIGFFLGFRNRPEEHPAVNGSEVALIRGLKPGAVVPDSRDAPKEEPAKESNAAVISAMLTSSSMWLVCLQAFCRAFGAAFFATWFPAYLEKSRGVKVDSAGFLAMLPLMGTVIGNVFGGVVVDRLLVKTGSKKVSRCGTAAAALTGCALCTFAAAGPRDPLTAVLILALGSLSFGLGSPAAWAVTMDISGKHTAVVFGIMNMAGNIGAFVCPILLGSLFTYIQKNGADWNLVLYLFAAVYATGAVSWALLNPHRSAVKRGATAS